MPSFFTAYVTAALAALPSGSVIRLTPSKIEPDTLAKMKADCDRFQSENKTDLAFLDAANAGRVFWLTRNGFDVGQGIPGTRSQRLTDAAKAFGPFPLTVDEDGVIRNE